MDQKIISQLADMSIDQLIDKLKSDDPVFNFNVITTINHYMDILPRTAESILAVKDISAAIFWVWGPIKPIGEITNSDLVNRVVNYIGNYYAPNPLNLTQNPKPDDIFIQTNPLPGQDPVGLNLSSMEEIILNTVSDIVSAIPPDNINIDNIKIMRIDPKQLNNINIDNIKIMRIDPKQYDKAKVTKPKRVLFTSPSNPHINH